MVYRWKPKYPALSGMAKVGSRLSILRALSKIPLIAQLPKELLQPREIVVMANAADPP